MRRPTLMHARGEKRASDVAVIKGTRGTTGSEKRQMKGEDEGGCRKQGRKVEHKKVEGWWWMGGGGLTFTQQGASIKNKCCVCVQQGDEEKGEEEEE